MHNNEKNKELTPEEGSFPATNETVSKPKANIRPNNSLTSDGNKLQETIGKNKANNTNINKKNLQESNGSNKNENDPSINKNSEVTDEAYELALKKLEKFGIKGKLAADLIRRSGTKEKVGKLVDKAIKKIKNERKRRIIRLLAPIMPYILSFVAIVLVIVIVMSQLMLVMESLDKALINVSTGIEKAANFLSGEGWKTENQQFFETLENEYRDSLRFSDIGLDIPLVAATIHYTKLNDVSIYKDDAGELDKNMDNSNDNDGLFSGYISAQEMKNFYYVSNSKLGSIYNLWPGERKLIGHMVDISISMEKYTFSEALSKWGDFFHYFGKNVNANIVKVILRALNPYQKVREIIAYETVDTGGSSDSYYGYKFRNIRYEIQELNAMFESAFGGIDTSEIPSVDDEESEKKGIWPAPNIKMNIDEEKYYQYLVNVYIPGTYFSGEKYSIDQAEIMAREIFRQRDEYLYLIGEDTGSSNYFGNNIGVNITSCNLPNVIDTVSLYDYIRGTLYAEGGLYNPTEFLKAQAIAIKNYLFVKNGVKPGEIPSSLTIKSCQMNQVFCNVEKGCHSLNDGTDLTNKRDNYDTSATGPDADGNYNNPPLTDTTKLDKLKEIVDSTLDQFIVKDGKFVSTQYRSDCVNRKEPLVCNSSTNIMDQNIAIKKAQSGETFDNILKTFYDGELTTIQLSSTGYPLDIMYTTISSRFGWRNHPISHCCRYHQGYDFDVPAEEEIYSVANGVVTATSSGTGYGNYVEIGHGEESNGVYEFYTLYAHMIRRPLVGKGDLVKMGEVIGNVGSTGASTGAHLHFEVFKRVNGQKLSSDPGEFLKGYNFIYKNSSHYDTEQQCLNAGVPHC